MLACPAPHGCGDEFRPVIGTQHLGCTMCQGSQVKHFDHVDGSNAPLNAQSQVLARELINDDTDLKDTPLPVRVELEINGPHLPGALALAGAVGAARRGLWALRGHPRKTLRKPLADQAALP